MPPLKETSPLRRKLGIELRLLREAAKLTADEAAAALETSASTISRSETGKVNVHPRDVDAMLRLYGLNDDRKREALVAIARKSRERGWWHEFRTVVSTDLANYMSIEYGASSIRIFQTLLVPGLLQTREYTRAVAAVFPRAHSCRSGHAARRCSSTSPSRSHCTWCWTSRCCTARSAAPG
jgi:transcriptional regulator with XRE-family HTH domain